MSLGDQTFVLAQAAGTYVFAHTGQFQVPLDEMVDFAQLTPLFGLSSDMSLTAENAVLIFSPQGDAGSYKKLLALGFSLDVTVPSPILDMVFGGETIGVSGARVVAASDPWTSDALNSLPRCPFVFDHNVSPGVSLSATLTLGDIQVPTALAPPN